MPSPYYRRKLLHQCGETLVALGRFRPAEQVFEELTEELEGSGSEDEVRVKCQLALIANRSTAGTKRRKNSPSSRSPPLDDPDVPGFLGRVYKDMWRTTFAEAEKLEDRLRAAMKNAAVARRSLETYQTAVRRNINRFYHGMNVVTLAVLARARRTGEPASPKSKSRTWRSSKSSCGSPRRVLSKDPKEEIWARATLGELATR